MRRSDREIKEMDEIIRVIKKCDVCRLARCICNRTEQSLMAYLETIEQG